jgi:hypothetical protein
MENPLRTGKLGAKEERLDKPLAHKSVKGLPNLIELILDGLSFYKRKFFSWSIIKISIIRCFIHLKALLSCATVSSHATVIILFNQI